MSIILGIHEDLIKHANGEVQSFSQRWIELATERGIEVKVVDAKMKNVLEELSRCSGFLWRFGYSPLELELSKRLIQSVEHGIGIPVFPCVKSTWHFEDKIAQYYLLTAINCPIPDTRVLWSEGAALNYCDSAAYPFVLKLSSGIQSRNVKLVENRKQAKLLIDLIFKSGVTTLEDSRSTLARKLGRLALPIKLLLGSHLPRGLQTGYFLVQEFLPENSFDTRITVVGNRAFGFRRMNRTGDFRASGSGVIDWNPELIDPGAIRLAFKVAEQLQTDSLAIDILYKGTVPVVAEISYTYASWAVAKCPGHWVHTRESIEKLSWVHGSLRPEDAIFEDFLHKINEA